MTHGRSAQTEPAHTRRRSTKTNAAADLLADKIMTANDELGQEIQRTGDKAHRQTIDK